MPKLNQTVTIRHVTEKTNVPWGKAPGAVISCMSRTHKMWMALNDMQKAENVWNDKRQQLLLRVITQNTQMVYRHTLLELVLLSLFRNDTRGVTTALYLEAKGHWPVGHIWCIGSENRLKWYNTLMLRELIWKLLSPAKSNICNACIDYIQPVGDLQMRWREASKRIKVFMVGSVFKGWECV